MSQLLGRLQLENHKLKASLGNIEDPISFETTSQKKEKELHQNIQ
jgi:regulator of replication initiation timing